MTDGPRDLQPFPRFFNAEELGTSLKEVATDVLEGNRHSLITRWFHSAKDVDLFIWVDDRQRIVKQQLSFFGQVVEWNVVEGLKTGLIVETERESDAPAINASETVRFDARPQRTPVEQALALVSHVSALSDIERQAVADNFNAAVSNTVPPELLVAEFSQFIEMGPEVKRRLADRPSGWRAVWDWLRRQWVRRR